MAQQCGPVFITGTIDDVCFYRMDGKYYVRMKSSLTRKRVMKDPAFRRTREHSALLGTASKIASRVYRLITGERKEHALYREMTGKAIYLLREGRDKEAVFLCLCNQYLEPEPVEEVAHEPYNKEVIESHRFFGISNVPGSHVVMTRSDCPAGPVFAAAVLLLKRFRHPLRKGSKQFKKTSRLLKKKVFRRTPSINQNICGYLSRSSLNRFHLDRLNIFRPLLYLYTGTGWSYL